MQPSSEPATAGADILVRFLGNWGLGDLLCADPLLTGLVERHGPATRLWLEGRTGNLQHHPAVAGCAHRHLQPDQVVEVKLFTHMRTDDYAELEAMPSLIEHMCSYAGVQPTDPRPRLHLGDAERAFVDRLGIDDLPQPRVAICADYLDPLRHWPLERWRIVARALHEAGASVIELGSTHRLGVGLDLVGETDVRQSAAVLERSQLYLGNNSGLFHYAQVAGTPCVVLFSLARPSRFVHPGATVYPVQADWLPCIDCMTRRFAAMQTQGCIADPHGRCMLEIGVESVLQATLEALEALDHGPTGSSPVQETSNNLPALRRCASKASE